MQIRSDIKLEDAGSRTSLDFPSFTSARPPLDEAYGLSFSQFPGDVQSRYEAVEISIYTIDDCTLVMEPGCYGVVITKDGHVVQETTMFANRAALEQRLNSDAIDNPLHFDGRHAMTFDSAFYNYYHWVCLALTRTFIHKQSISDDITYVFPQQIETLPNAPTWTALLHCLDLKNIRLLESGIYRIPKIDVVWTHPLQPTRIIDFPAARAAMRHISSCLVPKTLDQPRSRLYLGRKAKYQSRLSADRVEIVDAILKQYDFITIYPEDYSLEEQAKLINNAAVVVAAHGAALSNIIFCNEAAVVVELNGRIDGMMRPWFYQLAAGLGLEYKGIDTDSPQFEENLRTCLSAVTR